MNYRKFYALLAQLPYNGDGTKEDLVKSHTRGRTASLKEMTVAEYDALIHELENIVGKVDLLRKARSITLKLLTQLKVDTSDWEVVDNFCTNARVMGIPFRMISIEEHVYLQRRLRMILRKVALQRDLDRMEVQAQRSSPIDKSNNTLYN